MKLKEPTLEQRVHERFMGQLITIKGIADGLGVTPLKAEGVIHRLRRKGHCYRVEGGWRLGKEQPTDNRGIKECYAEIEGYGSGGKIALEEAWPAFYLHAPNEIVLGFGRASAPAGNVKPA